MYFDTLPTFVTSTILVAAISEKHFSYLDPQEVMLRLTLNTGTHTPVGVRWG